MAQTAPNQTRYYGHGTVVAAEAIAAIRIPVSGILRNMYNKAEGAPGVGDTYGYALYLNGLITALVSQTAGAVDTESSDLVNALAVAAGDLVSVEIIISVTAAATRHITTLELKC